MSVEAASVPLTALAWASGSSTCPNDFKLKPQGSVITDIQFVSEKESLPSGFYYIAEFLEPRASVSKKKRLCVKSVSFNTADVAVLDVQLTAKSKVILPHYTCIGSAASRPIHPNKLSKRRSTLEIKEGVYDTGNIYSISGTRALRTIQCSAMVSLVNLNNIQIKSITDIENEGPLPYR
ncbi:UNVERIFIED_CONTAM: hypothetical protein FKN15_042860 [Acipenser sinensis]